MSLRNPIFDRILSAIVRGPAILLHTVLDSNASAGSKRLAIGIILLIYLAGAALLVWALAEAFR